ncbi:MAG: hypothetical protein ACI80K_004868, partial [Paracoccaceae bacterium]
DGLGPPRIVIEHRCGMHSAQLLAKENLACTSCHVQAY